MAAEASGAAVTAEAADGSVGTAEVAVEYCFCLQDFWVRAHPFGIGDCSNQLLSGVSVAHFPHQISEGLRLLPSGIFLYDVFHECGRPTPPTECGSYKGSPHCQSWPADSGETTS